MNKKKLLKEWMAKNNITEPYVVHHIDNEPNAIKTGDITFEMRPISVFIK